MLALLLSCLVFALSQAMQALLLQDTKIV